jgi:hypothetical protein
MLSVKDAQHRADHIRPGSPMLAVSSTTRSGVVHRSMPRPADFLEVDAQRSKA